MSKLEQKKERGSRVPGYDHEFGTRLKWVINKIGTQKRAAEVANVKPEMIAKYVAGHAKPSFYTIRDIANAAKVGIDWLATGDGVKTSAVDPVDDRLSEIENELNQAPVPMSDDDLRNAPEWAGIRDELRSIALNDDTKTSQRGRADLILKLAFSDEGATQRAKQRQAGIGDRLRRSRQVCEVAIKAVDWNPPRIIEEALRTAVFASDMKTEDAAFLLEAIKSVVEDGL